MPDASADMIDVASRCAGLPGRRGEYGSVKAASLRWVGARAVRGRRDDLVGDAAVRPSPDIAYSTGCTAVLHAQEWTSSGVSEPPEGFECTSTGK